MVASAAQKRSAGDLVKDVSVNLRTAHTVVHVNAHRTHAHTAGVMNEIVPDAVPAKGPVAAGVNCADVAGLQSHVMNLVELDAVLVSRKENRAVRMLVDEVMRNAMAHTFEQQRRHVTLRPAA